MQVRQYPFHVDPPFSSAVRDTFLIAGFVTQAWRSVTRARDRRVRAERAVETRATEPAEATGFRSTLNECGIEVVDLDQSMSTLMAEPESATTIKDLLGSLAGKRAAAPDLGARVQEILAKCGASPRTAAPSSPKPTAGPSSVAPPQAANHRERPRSPGFRREFTAAARAAEGKGQPLRDVVPPVATPPVSEPPQVGVSETLAPEPAATRSEACRTTAPAESLQASATLAPPNPASPEAGSAMPPLEGKAVPTEVGIVVALEELGRQSEALMKRLHALEALVESQAKRIEEAERKLEAVLRRLEAREEAARQQAQSQEHTEQELAEFSAPMDRVEAGSSDPIHVLPVDPISVSPGRLEDAPVVSNSIACEGSANEAPPVAAVTENTPTVASEGRADAAPTPEVEGPTAPPDATVAEGPAKEEASTNECAEADHTETLGTLTATSEAVDPRRQLLKLQGQLAEAMERLETRVSDQEVKLSNTNGLVTELHEKLEEGAEET